MTRKDYEKVAKLFKDGTEIVTMMYALMDIFEEENPRFNREIFLKACGL
jgi:hypothetical protein